MKTLLTYLISFLFILNNSITFAQYTEQEKSDLLFTLQEEKIAYDFYKEMFDKYNKKIFGNIMNSEQVHREHVLNLLNSLNIEVTDNYDSPGEFSNKELAELYEMLSQIGSYSYEDALRAAAKYEEQDIGDLRKFYAGAENEQIKALYQCLENATQNHLRSFVKVLKNEGINYKPNVLSVEDFNEIINSTNQSGDCFQEK